MEKLVKSKEKEKAKKFFKISINSNAGCQIWNYQQEHSFKKNF